MNCRRSHLRLVPQPVVARVNPRSAQWAVEFLQLLADVARRKVANRE